MNIWEKTIISTIIYVIIWSIGSLMTKDMVWIFKSEFGGVVSILYFAAVVQILITGNDESSSNKNRE